MMYLMSTLFTVIISCVGIMIGLLLMVKYGSMFTEPQSNRAECVIAVVVGICIALLGIVVIA